MRRGISCNVVRIAADEILRMSSDPRMIGSDMVGHEIQNQVQAPFRELPAGYGKTFRSPKMLVDHITPHTIGRAHVVLGPKVRKCAAKVIQQAFVLMGNGDASGTSLPDSHQPHCVEAKGGDPIPLGGRYRI
jgi:hypothetical protein